MASKSNNKLKNDRDVYFADNSDIKDLDLDLDNEPILPFDPIVNEKKKEREEYVKRNIRLAEEYGKNNEHKEPDNEYWLRDEWKRTAEIYVLENKDMEATGDILGITAGAVCKRLKKLDVNARTTGEVRRNNNLKKNK